MKLKLTLPLAVFLMLLTVALCTGSQLFLLLSILILLVVAAAFIAVFWASATLTVDGQLSGETVYRGDDVVLSLRVHHRGLLPVAPLLLELTDPSGNRERDIRLKNMPNKVQSMRLPIHAAHVGVFSVGLHSCTVEDLLGLVRKKVPFQKTSFELLVLPRTFDIEPLKLAPGDPGSELMARATEDLSAPSDVRNYQPGDAMKKIHWKLSLRKRELMVRKFDEPILQDVLILMDCSRPPSWGHPQAEADLRDTLLETAASVLTAQLSTDHQFRLPLLGSHPVDVVKTMGLPIAMDYLSRVDFSETDRFERVLAIESSRLRKVGCVVIISARLNIPMVDIMIRIHRAGPNIRLYLVTFAPDDENVLPLIGRLRQASIEVSYVTPDL
ncbi:DUF58 domain-containing protein [Aristaeella lactis]|uniref:Uncharacterized conserved protein, DUF58 family, contains vWF domain n=1 Tax=Aristaeella lactis TaxID=3046383 RepID=A0AC61PHX0_9FIRM|nr:DUF58 domain-containing protein [Aristaeella lactis]QUA53559.1 DUF58 domain-containing protein [Aristaeella lactis]SMC36757.1 Uncharacterized conserved protein, DUF58 family, contains vWF domain [Aristaeella lactis]